LSGTDANFVSNLCRFLSRRYFNLQTGSDSGEEPLYVNAKQYHRILKRRQARAKLEALGRIPKERQVNILYYLSLIIRYSYI